MVRKVSHLPTRLLRGRDGKDGKDGETRIAREVVEKPMALDSVLDPIKKDIAWIKKRKPEWHGGGGQAVGSYHKVTSNEIAFTKHSFHEGLNIIGVASGVATTVRLPGSLDPTHQIVIKDELGVAGSYPITVAVSPNS